MSLRKINSIFIQPHFELEGSMEVSRDGQICAIFGKGDLFGANPKTEQKMRSSANVRALRKPEVIRQKPDRSNRMSTSVLKLL